MKKGREGEEGEEEDEGRGTSRGTIFLAAHAACLSHPTAIACPTPEGEIEGMHEGEEKEGGKAKKEESGARGRGGGGGSKGLGGQQGVGLGGEGGGE